MQLLHRLLLASCLLLGITGRAGAAEPPARKTEPAPQPAALLQQGMSAEQVKKIMGEPAKVRPMKAPKGTAEVWEYYREVPGPITQIPVTIQSTTVTVQGADGVWREQKVDSQPVYRQARKLIRETTALLMFNGMYINQKRTAEVVGEYE